MRKLWLGFIIGIIVVLLGGFCYVRFGFVNPRADIPINSIEKTIAMPSLDAAVDRRAPDIKNPIGSSCGDSNLVAGMKVYQTNCASCHGDIHHPHGMFADALYPRAPQFFEDVPDMPENQNFYIIQHGIRLSGMPAWKQILSEQEMWQVTTFLSHIEKLPPSVFEQWKVEAGTPTNTDSTHNPASTEGKP
jgi:thiosulfate dehydrogenase